jgi:hypothetical protein
MADTDAQTPEVAAAIVAQPDADAPLTADQTSAALAVTEPVVEEVRPKPRRARRGPQPDTGDEARTTVLLTTSRYQDGQGGVLRRGRPVNIPESRLDGLLLKGKVRVPAKGELERALATWPAVDLF